VTLDQITVFGVLIVTLFLFVTEKWRYDVVSLLALLTLTIAGIVPANQAFAGFGHPAVITVAAVLVLSRGLQNSGIVDLAASWLLRVGNRPIFQVAALTGLVALLSGFINNVGALALLLPVTIRMARHSGNSPSVLLMPLAFGSLLGGMTTLIGTPPNIIIAAFRVQTGSGPFRMFDFAPVGVGVALVGLLYLSLIGWRLVPRRSGLGSTEELFKMQDYVAELRVSENAKIIGKTLHDLEFMTDEDVMVVGVVRGELKLPAPSQFEIVRADDILIVEANSEALKKVMDAAKLEMATDIGDGEKLLGSDEVSVMEAVVVPDSQIEGNTAWTLSLRWRYGINLLAVARSGERVKQRLRDIQFRAGDILLLQGTTERLHQALPALGCLPLAERDLRVAPARHLIHSLVIFIGAVTCVALGWLTAPVAFVGAALLMILCGLLSVANAFRAIDGPILVLLGAMIPVAQALESTGGAEMIAGQLFRISHWLPPAGVLVAILVITMFLSDLVNNAAAAVLMAPIAIGVAKELGALADPFLISVAVGASCAFLTPIGHQSNALVMGPGGYRFGDYWRMGLILEVIILIVGVPLILWFWPLGVAS
jgi:di/tricarboxylate transporter